LDSVSYPKNIYGETPHGAMANEITSLKSELVMKMLRRGALNDGTTGLMALCVYLYIGRSYAAALFKVEGSDSKKRREIIWCKWIYFYS
jgi:hypothetical protein